MVTASATYGPLLSMTHHALADEETYGETVDDQQEQDERQAHPLPKQGTLPASPGALSQPQQDQRPACSHALPAT